MTTKVSCITLHPIAQKIVASLPFRDFLNLSNASRVWHTIFQQEMYARAIEPIKGSLDQKKIDRISVEELQKFLDALNAQQWGSKQQVALEKIPLCAFKAFQQMRFNYLQFGTALLFWSALKQYPKEQFGFLKSTDPLFKQLLNSTLFAKERKNAHLFSKAVSLLNKEQKKRFYDLIQKKPLSERNILLIKKLPNSESPLITEIRSRFQLNTLMVAEYKNEEWWVIPTMSIIQSCLAAQLYHSTLNQPPVFIIPTAGLSDFTSSHYETWPMAVASPFHTFPKELDNRDRGNEHHVSMHDIYHSQVLNYFPQPLKESFEIWRKCIQRVKAQNSVEKKFLDKVEEGLREFDILRYFYKFGVRKETTYNLSEEMQLTIGHLLTEAKIAFENEIPPDVFFSSKLCERIFEQVQLEEEKFSQLGIKKIASITTLSFSPFIHINFES